MQASKVVQPLSVKLADDVSRRKINSQHPYHSERSLVFPSEHPSGLLEFRLAHGLHVRFTPCTTTQGREVVRINVGQARLSPGDLTHRWTKVRYF